MEGGGRQEARSLWVIQDTEEAGLGGRELGGSHQHLRCRRWCIWDPGCSEALPPFLGVCKTLLCASCCAFLTQGLELGGVVTEMGESKAALLCDGAG